MGYANGVSTNVIGGVDISTRRAYVDPIFGPANLCNSTPFVNDLVEQYTEMHADSTKS